MNVNKMFSYIYIYFYYQAMKFKIFVGKKL